MKFELRKSIEIIKRTPHVLNTLLQGISDDWIYNNEGENTWCVFDVVGHLIICEKTDFIPRTKLIISDSDNKMIVPIDKNAQIEYSKGKVITDLLEEFEQLRNENIQILFDLQLTENDLNKTGLHPKIGMLTLAELLATWVVHDLNHLSQISRVMAKQYKNEVGPFIEYLSILN